MDEITVIDTKTGEEKQMKWRYANILQMAHPNRYLTRELRAGEGTPEPEKSEEETTRRKPGRPRKNAE